MLLSKLPANGVYIVTSDKQFHKIDTFDATNKDFAIGIGFITDKQAILIYKKIVSEIWGYYSKGIDKMPMFTKADSVRDFMDGKKLSEIVLNDSDVEKSIIRTVNKLGVDDGYPLYVPSIGQLYEMMDNWSEIAKGMDLIGAQKSGDTWIHSSNVGFYRGKWCIMQPFKDIAEDKTNTVYTTYPVCDLNDIL